MEHRRLQTSACLGCFFCRPVEPSRQVPPFSTPEGRKGRLVQQDEANRRFREWLWPHRDVVLRTARLLVRDHFVADDLAQETMLKAFRSIDRFEPGTDARAWLLTILRNARIDRLRTEASRGGETSLNELAADLVDRPHTPVQADWRDADALLERLGDEEIIRAMRQLPEEIRWTLLLVDVEGLDQSDAAGVLGVPVGTVKSRASRGRSMLRELLEPRARELGLIR